MLYFLLIVILLVLGLKGWRLGGEKREVGYPLTRGKFGTVYRP